MKIVTDDDDDDDDGYGNVDDDWWQLKKNVYFWQLVTVLQDCIALSTDDFLKYGIKEKFSKAFPVFFFLILFQMFANATTLKLLET